MVRSRAAAWRLLAPLLGLLLLAFGLRVAGLERQSIWVDEGFSVDFSSRTASDMTAMWKARGGVAVIGEPAAPSAANDPLAIAVDIHPPLYYLLLHEWLPLAGRSEFAVRFPSVIVGVLLVLALYKLGASLGSVSTGLAAAGVGALAPFYVAYSQEARMYAPVALFSAFSLYFTWRVLAGDRSRWPWLALVVCSSLALYTHYSAVLVIAAENALVAAVVLWRLARRRAWSRLLGTWSAAQLLQLGIFFPWLRTTIGQVAKYNENLWMPNWQHELTETFRAFDAGLWLPPDEGLRLAIPISAVLLGGLAAAAFTVRRQAVVKPGVPLPIMAGGATALEPRSNRLLPRAPSQLRTVRTLWFAGGALVLETLLALAAFQIRPEFHPRYLMVLATPYYLLLGLALATLWRRWWPVGLLAGGVVGAIFVVGLAGYEFDPNFAKDDTRTLAQYLASRTTADDVIVLDAPEPLGYYYHGPAELAYVPGEQATAASKLTEVAAGKKRVVFVQWFLSTSDPKQLLPFLLQKYGRLVENKTFRGYFERAYVIPERTSFDLTQADNPVGANFDNMFLLKAVGLGPATGGDPPLLSRLSDPVAASGQDLMLALNWQLLRPTTKDYKVTAYLTDDHGHLAGQADLLLRRGQAATTRWQPGDEATAYYVLPTLPGLMPGAYQVHVAVYPDGEQERLSVLDSTGAPGGGSVSVATVEVLAPTIPAAPAELKLAHTAAASSAQGISLIAYDSPPSTVVQGDALHVTVAWQATAAPPAGLQTRLTLQQDGATAPAWQTSITPRFPTDRWRASDVYRDWDDAVLPPQLPAGLYTVLVALGDGPPTAIGQVQVLERKRDFTAPVPAHLLSAQLGDGIELLGYDQDKPAYRAGDTARVTLYWRSRAPMSDSFTAFLHVLDSGRHVVAQIDAVPDHGLLPTTAWLPGEIVRDVYDMPLKPGTAAGIYQLEAGFYRGDTGVRLKAISNDIPSIDDGLLIGSLTVTK